jgi:hypothetical protein
MPVPWQAARYTILRDEPLAAFMLTPERAVPRGIERNNDSHNLDGMEASDPAVDRKFASYNATIDRCGLLQICYLWLNSFGFALAFGLVRCKLIAMMRRGPQT